MLIYNLNIKEFKIKSTQYPTISSANMIPKQSLTRVSRPKRQLFGHFVSSSDSPEQKLQVNSELGIHLLPTQLAINDDANDQLSKNSNEYHQQDTGVSVIQTQTSHLTIIEPSSPQKPTEQPSQQIEHRLMEKIVSIDYSQLNGNLFKQFTELIREHITVSQYMLQPETIVGINVLTNGVFHQYWGFVIGKQSVEMESFKKKYYEHYRYLIKQNIQAFQRTFNYQSKHNPEITDNSNTTKIDNDNDKQILEKHLPQVKTQEKRTNTCLSPKQKKIFKQKVSVNQSPVEKHPASQNTKPKLLMGGNSQRSPQQSQPSDFIPQIELPSPHEIPDKISPSSRKPIIFSPSLITTPKSVSSSSGQLTRPLSMKLLAYKQLNNRRISAEIVCRFLGIEENRIFGVEEIDIEEVLEMYEESKFQYAVVMGRITNEENIKIEEKCGKGEQKENSSCNEKKVFINCYKFMGLEQLIRLELSYGEIYGFIAYDNQYDFYKDLRNIRNYGQGKDIKRKEQSKKKRKENGKINQKEERIMEKSYQY